jgi:hypothetical protein
MIGELTGQTIGFLVGPIEAPDQRRGEMDEQEAKKEISQAKKDLLEAKAKLRELSVKLMELSDVVAKIEAAHARLNKIDDKMFSEGFGKKSLFHRIDNEKD